MQSVTLGGPASEMAKPGQGPGQIGQWAQCAMVRCLGRYGPAYLCQAGLKDLQMVGVGDPDRCVCVCVDGGRTGDI